VKDFEEAAKFFWPLEWLSTVAAEITSTRTWEYHQISRISVQTAQPLWHRLVSCVLHSLSSLRINPNNRSLVRRLQTRRLRRLEPLFLVNITTRLASKQSLLINGNNPCKIQLKSELQTGVIFINLLRIDTRIWRQLKFINKIQLCFNKTNL
jgi:hypothetical protein